MRIVIVSRSQPLEQMIAYIVERGVDIEIVGEAEDVPESGQIIAQEQPEWLFLLAESHGDMIQQINEVRGGHTDLRIAAFAEGGKHVRVLRGTQRTNGKPELMEKWDEMSASDFIALLMEEPATSEHAPRLIEKDEHQAK